MTDLGLTEGEGGWGVWTPTEDWGYGKEKGGRRSWGSGRLQKIGGTEKKRGVPLRKVIEQSSHIPEMFLK